MCEDPDAPTLVFSEPRKLTDRACVMMNKPTVLSTGEWLFPMTMWQDYVMKGCWGVVLSEDTQVGSFAVKSADNGKTFSVLGCVTPDPKTVVFDENMLLEKQDGVLAMYIRTRYGIGVSYSYDRGESWTETKDSGLGGPDSRFHIRRLPSGRVLLLNHYQFKGRNNLAAFLSEDDGATFPYVLMLDERDQVSYPDCTLDADGGIVITYDRQRGGWSSSFAVLYRHAREILTARVTEADIMAGKLVDEKSYLARVISKLGKYAHEEERNVFGEHHRFTNREAAEKLANLTDKGQILAKLFAWYPIPCFAVNGVDVVALDACIARFDASETVDVAALTEIVSLVRGATAEKEKGEPMVTRIKEFVKEHLLEEITTEALAERLGISRYYMIHLFKTATGTTIGAYRRALRMTEAKHRLLASEDRIADIAADCGYEDAGYFSRLFAEREGLTPSEYRSLHKK